MSSRGSKNGQRERTEASRARQYAARSAWHDGQVRRRVRDNAIAVIAGVVIIAGSVASQVAHAQTTAPEPEPSPSVSPTPASEPTQIPEPDTTDAPTE